MSVSISFHMFGEVLFERELLRLDERGRDMSPAFRLIARKWINWNYEQFASEGRRASGGWDELAEETIRKRGSAHPILVETGALMDELTDSSNIEINEDFMHMTLPDEVDEYGAFHQSGTTHMPQRRPMEFTERDRRDMVRDIQRYLVTGEA